ncbi:hypothetical protein PCANC_28046 [Puccinia coronata f. sp. avenae]|uniref:Uncharacterized protein n=1 Tax=Puccinia coronata f. sp. avenae TaxID=200324 RepID=A0A2N5TET0_9BASI|nr:hypothetical protein PCANC_28046 [Puccinia coronata f. sp. avenae]
MPGPNNAKWGNGSHYCVITLTAPSTPPPSGSSSPSPTPTPTTQGKKRPLNQRNKSSSLAEPFCCFCSLFSPTISFRSELGYLLL